MLAFVAPAAADNFPRLDEAWRSIPDPAVVERIARYHPVFDFDTDSCLPSAAISRSGEQNGGLDATGSITGKCRKTDTFLDLSNTYHRWVRAEKGGNMYELHIFALYFLKDQWGSLGGGHRHDFEEAAIAFKNGVPISAAASGHGGYTIKLWDEIDKDGTHPKFVYHKDGLRTHAMRFAKTNETAENDYGRFVIPAIASWDEFHGDTVQFGTSVNNAGMRQKLNSYSYKSAHLATNDKEFVRKANKAAPGAGHGYPDFPVFTAADIGQAANSKRPIVLPPLLHVILSN
jgi:hypothetical protein